MKGLAVILLLSGCATLPVDENSTLDQGTCNADNWRELIGKPEAELYGALGNLRVIHPGQPVTKDYNPNRLNAVIGADGRIKKFGCY